MAKFQVLNFGGINNKAQPFIKNDGQLTRSVNLFTDEVGAKRKRPGYVALNGTADGNQVNTLFQFRNSDDSVHLLYRASGSSLYYYDVGAGTGDWTLCANGTIGNGAHVGHAVLDDTLILGDGMGSTRHTTNGTSFTNTDLAPVGEYFTEAFGRIYIGGTASDLFWSTTNDATNWQTSGTSDSSSVKITGAGKINGVFTADNRVIATKTTGVMKRWDDFSLDTIPTSQGYSSPYSRAEIEGFNLGINRLGIFGFDGGRPELLSSSIEKQIHNPEGNAIAGTVFDTAPGGLNRYEYMLSVGTITDGATKHQIPDAIITYNYQSNEWYNFRFAHRPSAFGKYRDNSENDHYIFGDTAGQVYQFAGTATSDAGKPIEAVLEGFLHLNKPAQDKVWRKITAFANPGCGAQIQVAAADTFNKDTLTWMDIGSLRSGVAELRFTQRGRFLFYRLYEYSSDPGFQFYGFEVEADEIGD